MSDLLSNDMLVELYDHLKTQDGRKYVASVLKLARTYQEDLTGFTELGYKDQMLLSEACQMAGLEICRQCWAESLIDDKIYCHCCRGKGFLDG